VLQQMRSAAKYIWLFIIVAFVGGFLLVESSGLIGRTPLTPTTPVAEVNGREILYQEWQQRVQQALQNQQRSGRTLSQDEVRQLENETLDEMIQQVLLEQEYRRRGIGVTDEEVRDFARYAPPPFLYNSPELQTEGRFDPVKYQRLLASPQARQGGLLIGLESYYRNEIPKEKLFEQIADGVYLTDEELWRTYQDEHDTTQVSYVVWRPEPDSAALSAVTDAEARAYFEKHKSEYERPGQAWLSVLRIPRAITAADSNATRDRLLKLRAEIAGGAKFEDVARRESNDSVSGANGGDLGRGARGRFVPAFETPAYRLNVRELSQPVLTPFGYHLIRVDEKKGDTLALRHILLRIQQSDSAATATDRQADELARVAAGSDDRTKLDTAAKLLGLPIHRARAVENYPAAIEGGLMVPSASAWAFGGARSGETSELFDDDNGYWIARLDSIALGGEPRFERVQSEVRAAVARERLIDRALPAAEQFATRAATSGIDAAALGANVRVVRSPPFTRVDSVSGLGRFSRPIGAAFGIPAGAVSAPIQDANGLYVLRVERRANANRAEFEKEKETLRRQRLQQMRQQRVQLFLEDLRKTAKIEDRRRDINAAARRVELEG
jgi:peptidyl-prolyl cis-trans isomerase D